MKHLGNTIFIVLALLFFATPVWGQNAGKNVQKIQGKIIAVAKKVTPAYVAVGGGSGVIISPDGYILSNHHVTRGIRDWLVVRSGGHIYRADMLGYDEKGDISLLKIRNGKNLPYVKLGDSDKVVPGQLVIAVGNPWGLSRTDVNSHMPTVTLGVVGAIHRYQGGYGDCIQIDAPINPGNSGGPTFDLQGRLLGINGQIRPRFGRRTFSGIGLAISINQIKHFLPVLKKGGEVHHGTLLRVKYDAKISPSGEVKVVKVPTGSSAYQAGLRSGDVFVKIEGYTPKTHYRLQGIFSIYPAGTKVKAQVRRKGKRITLTLPLERIPTYAEALAQGKPYRLPGTPYIGLDFGEPLQGGVEIIGVVEGSPAAKAGIKAGDIVLTFNGLGARDKWNLGSLLSSSSYGETIDLEIKRGKNTKTYSLVVANADDYPLKKYKSKKSPSSGGSTPTPTPPNGNGGPGGGTLPSLDVYNLGLTLGDINNAGHIMINGVDKGSMAEKKGFKAGDAVKTFNGKVLMDSYDLEDKIEYHDIKKPLVFVIVRKVKDKKGKVKTKEVTIKFMWKK